MGSRNLPDLFIIAAEPSADLHGEKLLLELLKLRPALQVETVSGPRMRKLGAKTVLEMENLQVMGFLDVVKALPKLFRHFFFLRNWILKRSPKAVVFIDYPGFNLRLAESLRKKGFQGKLIHFICPTVWAWGKKRVFSMEKNLDLLMTLFPFEKKCFEKSSLDVEYVGHPLAYAIPQAPQKREEKLIGIFPGSRSTEIERNFPLQIKLAKELQAADPEIVIGISISSQKRKMEIDALLKRGSIAKLFGSGFKEKLLFFPPEKNYELMKTSRLALATSGTVALELALHETPTIVNFAIRPLDLFLAQKVFKINLPFYCIVNLILNKEVFPELFGPNFKEKIYFPLAKKLWAETSLRERCIEGCRELRNSLGRSNSSLEAAKLVIDRGIL